MSLRSQSKPKEVKSKKNIKDLDFLIKNHEFLKPTILYRFLYRSAFEKISKRGYADFAYMSCTTRNLFELRRTNAAVAMRMICPKPFHGIIPYLIGESEIILPRNSRFLVNDIGESEDEVSSWSQGGHYNNNEDKVEKTLLRQHVTLTMLSQKL